MKHEFKIGDRIRVIIQLAKRIPKGALGTVIRDIGPTIGIKFDELIDGHGCGELCEYGYGWNCDRYSIEKLETTYYEIY